MSVADASVILPASALDELFEAPDLSDLDPSTHGGFKIVYHREVPLEMRLQTTDVAPAEAGTLEAIACKICVREGEDGRPKQVKVELSSEGDLFFSYTHIVDERQFNAMRDEQKLMVDFASYPSVLASSFTNAIKVSASRVGIAVAQWVIAWLAVPPIAHQVSTYNRLQEPHTFLAVFIMNRDGAARLDFIQNVVRGMQQGCTHRFALFCCGADKSDRAVFPSPTSHSPSALLAVIQVYRAAQRHVQPLQR